jgi:hypothetical protein
LQNLQASHEQTVDLKKRLHAHETSCLQTQIKKLQDMLDSRKLLQHQTQQPGYLPTMIDLAQEQVKTEISRSD